MLKEKKKNCNTKEGRAIRKKELEEKRLAKEKEKNLRELLRKKELEDKAQKKEKRNRRAA